MATYSSNTTIKINGAVAISNAGGPLYAAPADTYSIVLLTYVGTGVATFTIGAIPLPYHLNGSSGATYVYVGPGQTVSGATTGAGTFSAQGVNFINTP